MIDFRRKIMIEAMLSMSFMKIISKIKSTKSILFIRAKKLANTDDLWRRIDLIIIQELMKDKNQPIQYFSP